MGVQVVRVQVVAVGVVVLVVGVVEVVDVVVVIVNVVMVVNVVVVVHCEYSGEWVVVGVVVGMVCVRGVVGEVGVEEVKVMGMAGV